MTNIPSAGSPDRAKPVEVSGVISSAYFNSEGKQVNSGNSAFLIVRDGPRWQLKTEQSDSDPFVIGSDGKFIYTQIRGSANAPMDAAMIDEWGMALQTPAENLPWWFLIFSKHSALDASKVPLPWYVPRNDCQAFFCANEVVWNDQAPNLPKEFRFYFSEARIREANMHEMLSRQNLSGYDQATLSTFAEKSAGITNRLAGEGAVLAWTNLPFGSYPSAFELRVYDSLPERLNLSARRSSAKTSKVRILYQGKVTKVQEVDELPLLPVLQKPVFTTDYRFRDLSRGIECVHYGPLNQWMSNAAEVNSTMKPEIRFTTIKVST